MFHGIIADHLPIIQSYLTNKVGPEPIVINGVMGPPGVVIL